MTRAFAETFPNAPLSRLVELKIRDGWGESDSSLIGGTDGAIPADPEQPEPDAVAHQRRCADGGRDRVSTVLALGDDEGTTDYTGPTQAVVEGDCLAYLRTMAPSSVAAVVTSPPYNFRKQYGTYNDNRPIDEYLAEQGMVAEQVARVLRPDGHVFLNVGWNSDHPWRSMEVAKEWGRHLQLQQTITWVKSLAIDARTLRDAELREPLEAWAESLGINPKAIPVSALRVALQERTIGHIMPSRSDRYLTQCCEPIYHFTPAGRSRIDPQAIGVPYVYKDQPARFGHNRRLRCRGNVWHIPYQTTQSRADRDLHPASYPIALAEQCLRLAALKPGELVIDPFMGTGATLIAAQQLGLSAIGIDIDPAYCAAARRRLGQSEALEPAIQSDVAVTTELDSDCPLASDAQIDEEASA